MRHLGQELAWPSNLRIYGTAKPHFPHTVVGMPLGTGVTTIGIPIGLFVIVSAFVLTGIYVSKANSKFDALIRRTTDRARPLLAGSRW